MDPTSRLLIKLSWCERSSCVSTFLPACESSTLTAELERRIQVLEMRCYRRLLNVSDERGGSQQNSECSCRNGNSDGMATSQDPLRVLQGAMKGARRRRDGKITSKKRQNCPGVWGIPEGSGRQGQMERYCCSIFCGALTAVDVTGLRWD